LHSPLALYLVIYVGKMKIETIDVVIENGSTEFQESEDFEALFT
jgi:hypothetical protein